MTVAELPPIRRLDDITVLMRLVPLLRSGCEGLEYMAVNIAASERKDILVYLWQQNEKCLAEIENKIRDKGGNPDGIRSLLDMPIPQEPFMDSFLREKAMLLHCINQKNDILQVYSEVRRQPMSFDVRILVQRHQLQALDDLERLTSIYLPYTATLATSEPRFHGSVRFHASV